jgi:hypothetical protein
MARSAFRQRAALSGARLEPSGTALLPFFETPREGARLLRMRSNLLKHNNLMPG